MLEGIDKKVSMVPAYPKDNGSLVIKTTPPIMKANVRQGNKYTFLYVHKSGSFTDRGVH